MVEQLQGAPAGTPGLAGLLTGRRALVTGAASGIGAAIAQAFREAGATVVGADITSSPGLVHCDVRSEDEVVGLFEGPARDMTDIVHAAGIAPSAPIEEVSLATWQAVIDTNLTGTFLIGREVARRFRASGSLTFIASAGGLSGSEMFTAYCASKFGVVGFTRCLARELAPRGIRVNAVCPSGVRTPMSDATIASDSVRFSEPEEVLRARYNASVPIGRWAEPTEVASVCVFLASQLAAHVAGAALLVDGAENA